LTVPITIPDLGGTEELTLAAWLKAPGERVEAGEVVAEVLTEKVNTEITAPAAGVVDQLLVEEGERVETGQTIATLREA
jgi:2-oxoglutarate dehydrogenase E2 component (dihydrolipoamide succinyltransferase)